MFVFGFLCLCILIVGGCAMLDSFFGSDTPDQIAAGGQAVGEAAGALGLPWGWIITLAAGVAATGTAAYRKARGLPMNPLKKT
jgi:hypothetical protein